MEDIYENGEYDKSIPSRSPTIQTAPRRSQGGVVLCLGLLTICLLAGLIGVSVHYHKSAAELSSIRASLTKENELLKSRLTFVIEQGDLMNRSLSSTIKDKDLLNRSLSSLTEEKKQLHANLTKTTEEWNRLIQKTTCPGGLTVFRCSFYFLSTESGSWTKAREDCINRGADLVVINTPEEQTFLSDFTKVETWIGLNDRDVEGTWKWVDGSPLTIRYWGLHEPNNGFWPMGKEDCAQLGHAGTSNWNDRQCETNLHWICEKDINLTKTID